jgi:pentatricopeptide repeat protein
MAQTSLDTGALPSDAESFLGVAYEVFVGVRLELFVFFIAVTAYFLAFGNLAGLRAPRAAAPKTRSSHADVDMSAEPVEKCAVEMKSAADRGDHRMVLKCWNVVKKSSEVVPVNLGQVVAALQKFRPEPDFVVREVVAYFKLHPAEFGMDEFNELLDTLGRRVDSELMEQLVMALPEMELTMDGRTYEILMQLHFLLRDFAEVHLLERRMEQAGIAKTARAWVVLLKTALKEGALDQAINALDQTRSLWRGQSAQISGLDGLLAQLAMLAAKEHRTARVVEALADFPGLPLDTLAVMLPACLDEHREDLVAQLYAKMKKERTVPDSRVAVFLLNGLSRAPGHANDARRLLEDTIASESTEWTADLVSAAFAVAAGNEKAGGSSADPDLARRAYAAAKAGKQNSVQVRVAFLKGFVDLDMAEEGCAVFETDVVENGLRLGSSNEKVLLSLALRCGRQELGRALMSATSSADMGKQVAMIRQCAQDNNVEGARAIFGSVQERGEATPVVSNALLDALVSCGDLPGAEQWMKTAAEKDLVDVVSYNTVLKAYVSDGSAPGIAKAMGVLKDMPKHGVTPNTVTFNEILNALVQHRTGKHIGGETLALMKQMEANEVKPNHVTASILLKSLDKNSSDQEVRTAMGVVGMLEESVDEVLLSSIIEACVRLERPTMLRQYLSEQVPPSGAIFGAHTFGSLIKAYGYVGDTEAVWRCWKEMRNRHIAPTPITLGCMVEAVVSNGDTEGAFDLIHTMEQDDACRHHLNSVIYCSVLKGFAREKRLDRVLKVFEEMKQKKVVFSTAAFNATIDACARANRMDKLPWLEDEMRAQHVVPNVVTYSTMIKGYANSGDMPKAFALLDLMQADPGMQPDEIVYNSLIDGCARCEDYQGGLKVLDLMKRQGIRPSNFTISVVIKLCCRCRKLDLAFRFVEDLKQEFNLRPNNHVYANLIQACVYCRSLTRGLQVFEEMLQKGVSPLPRVYGLLLRNAVQTNQPGLVKGLIELAFGIRRDLPSGVVLDSRIAESSIDAAAVNDALSRLCASGHEETAEVIFVQVQGKLPGLRLDRKVAKQLLTKAGGGGRNASQADGPRYRGDRSVNS